jgi:hypothetical protein
MEYMVSFMPWLLYPQYPLDGRLGGLQSQSTCGSTEKNSCPCRESKLIIQLTTIA